MKLLVVVNNHNCQAILEQCAGLRSLDPDLSVIVACSPGDAHKYASLFARLGITAFSMAHTRPPSPIKAPAPAAVPAKAPQPSRLQKLTPYLALVPFYQAAREALILRRMRRAQTHAAELLEREAVSIIIAMSDRSHDYVEAPIAWAARRAGIPVVLPFVSHYDIDSALEYRRGPDGRIDPQFRPFWPPSPYKWLAAWRFRGQRHKGCFFLPAYQLNANRRAGTLSAYPWWVGNGLSDIVCVDSRHTAEKFTRHRVPAAKLVITGHLAYDRVFEGHSRRAELRTQIIRKYRFDPTKPLLVFSMPQYAEQGYMNWERHWAEIDAIMAGIAAAGANLLISLHPRSDRAAYRHIAEKFDCRFADETLADVIAAADLFLASNSSTFSWAILCGIRAIAVKSPIHLLFDYLENVHPVYDSENICAEIRRLIDAPPPSFETDWRTLSREQVFDGRFDERFLALLNQAAGPA